MKKVKFLFALTALTVGLISCDKDTALISGETSGQISQLNITTDASTTEAAEEVATIGHEGFRMVELENKNIGQQSIWKKDGTWKPESELEQSYPTKIAAIYPSGDPVNNNGDVVFAAGANNMTCLTDVKDSKADIFFTHRMCHISYTLMKKSGESITAEKAELVQPAGMTYNIISNKTSSVEDFQAKEIQPSGSYVIPSDGEYIFKLTIEGRSYSYKVVKKLEANKKYLFNLVLEEKSISLSSLNCEQWSETTIEEGELTAEEKEVELPQYAIKKEDKVDKGFYYACVKEGVIYGVHEKDYFKNKKVDEVFGILISTEKGHRFIMSLEAIGQDSRPDYSKFTWSNSKEKIDGVTTDEFDYNGQENTKNILKWINKSADNTANAAKMTSEFEFKGVKGWYLPSAGEMYEILEEATNTIADMFDWIGCWKLTMDTEYDFWTSTQSDSGDAYKVSFNYSYIGTSETSEENAVIPVHAF